MIIDPDTLFIESVAVPGTGFRRSVLLGALVAAVGMPSALFLIAWLISGGRSGLPFELFIFSAVLAFAVIVFLGATSWFYARRVLLWPLIIRQVGDGIVVQRATQRYWASIDTLRPDLAVSAVNMRRINQDFFAGFRGSTAPAPIMKWGVWLRLQHAGRFRFVLLAYQDTEDQALESLLDWGRLLAIDTNALPAEIVPPPFASTQPSPIRRTHCETIF